MMLRIGLLHTLLLIAITTLSYAEVVEVETVIYSTDNEENSFNEQCLSEFTCQKDVDASTLFIEFYYDSSNCPVSYILLLQQRHNDHHQFRITLYDRNGNYLNHFTTGEDIGQSCAIIDSHCFWYNLAYSVVIRDLRDAEIVGLSFHQP